MWVDVRSYAGLSSEAGGWEGVTTRGGVSERVDSGLAPSQSERATGEN